MSATAAHLFEDIAALADFVRLCGDAATAPGDFRLIAVRAERASAGATVLFLIGQTPRNRSVPAPAVELHVQGQSASWKMKGKPPGQGRVLQEEREQSLLALVRPRPWRREPDAVAHVVFRLDDPELLPWLAAESLRLGNDRLQFADVEGPNGPFTVVRVENPSFFLLQQAREDFGSRVSLWYPVAEDFYLPWGMEHPLADLWRRSRATRPAEWVLQHADGAREHLQPVRWQDIYQAMEFRLEFPAAPLALQQGQRNRFVIPLRAERRRHAAPPELWLLTEQELPRFEALLASIDEEDLAGFLLAMQQHPTEGMLFLVREKRSGTTSRHLEFGGRPFAPYKGYPNLFVPTELEFQPQVRRDVYKDLFKLLPGVLTLAQPEPGCSLRLLTLREEAFRPLGSLVEYHVARNEARLEALVRASTFDLGAFARAAEVQAFLKRVGPAPVGTQDAADEADEGPRHEPAAEDSEPSSKARTTRKKAPARAKEAKPAEAPAPAPPTSTVAAEEARLERALITEGQGWMRWRDLMTMKATLRKVEEVAVCAVEGLWLAETPEDEGPLLDAWRRSLGAEPALPPAPTNLPGVTAFVLAGSTTWRSRPQEWLPDATRLLRSAEGGLRLKERWLLWREVLRANHDVREQARVRDDIRRQLAAGGLPFNQIPFFIRERLYRERELSRSSTTDGEAQVELEAVRQNLNVLSSFLTAMRSAGEASAFMTRAAAGLEGRAPAPALLSMLRGVLGRAWMHGLGEVGESAVQFSTALAAHDLPARSIATVLLYRHHAERREGAPGKRPAELEAVLARLVGDEKKSFGEAESSLLRREEVQSAAAFLSEENAARFYPKGGRFNQGPVEDLRRQNQEAVLEGSAPRIRELTRQGMTIGRTLKPMETARLVETLAENLVRLRWDSEASVLATEFATFADDVAGVGQRDPFYFLLKNANLVTGLLAIGRDTRARALLAECIRLAGTATVPVDFIDAASRLVTAVEGFPLPERSPLLHELSVAFAVQFTRHGQYATSALLQHQLLRVFDMMAEAAISKDRLAIALFRAYQQQDEFLILQRVLTEDPSLGPVRPEHP